MNRKIHINELSVLFSSSDPLTWLNQLRRLQESKSYSPKPYMPLRLAICAELAKSGTGQAVLKKELSKNTCNNAKTITAKSLIAFSNFLRWYPKNIASLQRSFVGPNAGDRPIRFYEYDLAGNFHVQAIDTQGHLVYIYFHCSDWPKAQEQAFIELLGVIANARYQARSKDVWFIDLQTGKKKSPAATSKRVQMRFRKILDHYTTLQKGLAA